MLESTFETGDSMEPVRSGLKNIMRDLLLARPPEEAVVLAWPLVCGKEVAARTQAISFSNGNLMVEVSDAAWRNQLLGFVSRYVNGYESLFGPLVLTVQFKTQPRAGAQPADKL